MMQGYAAPLDRMDRRVGRGIVRAGRHESRTRIEFSLQEALRFTELPHEREGRIYCFAHIALETIGSAASRATWMESVQKALTAAAREAIHARDPRARHANAVYFDHHEQAMTLLLQMSLREEAPSWFAGSLLGEQIQSQPNAFAYSIVKRMMDTLQSAVVGEIIVSSVQEHPVRYVDVLLRSISASAARDWISPYSARSKVHSETRTVSLSAIDQLLIRRAGDTFGWHDARVRWFTALVLLSSTSAMCGTPSQAIECAQYLLQTIDEQQHAQPAELNSQRVTPALSARVAFEEDGSEAPSSLQSESAIELESASSVLGESSQSQKEDTPRTKRRVEWNGAPTESAGLLFLLAVLRQLGIDQATKETSELIEANLSVQILSRIASQMRMHPDDPMLQCLTSRKREILPQIDWSGVLPVAAWPLNLRPLEPRDCSGESLVRAWIVASRRWLWLNHCLRLREVVERAGNVWSTRTDIDITFPLQHVDVRIRRAGLDLDPGWVPWLGKLGRVVRFHYRDAVETEEHV